MIKIFNANDRDFSTAGNIIIEPIKCIEYKKKSLNGWFIEVEVPIKYKEYISKDKLCVVKSKSKLNSQAFRIGENIEYSSKKIKFVANHVMFDAKDYVLLDVRPTNQNGLNALNYINARTDNISPFSMYSNVENINTAYFIRKNLLEAWVTIEERWGGVFDADNWNISFLTSVGNDNGETITYGKNMQGFDIFEDWSSVCTKLCPVGYDGLLLPETYIESDVQYEKPYTRVIDFQTNLEEEEQTQENLLSELRKNAEIYLEENKAPKVSYTIISNINDKLEIGDTIKVMHPFVEIFTEVLEYQYNLISKKVISLTFGNYSRDVKTKFENIKSSITQINQVLSKQEIAINTQTNLINTLNKNGYVYIDDNEILILDTLPKEKAKNVWRFGLGGIGFSSNGYEGPFEIAMTMDGQINANFITTGSLNVSRIEGLSGTLTSIELEMDSITETVSDQNQKISQVTQTVNEINSKISDIIELTTVKESTNSMLEFEDVNQSEPINIDIHPIGNNIAYLYPRDNLYPSDDLFMPNRVIRFTNINTNEIFDYELPDDLLIYDSENYDEFLLDYDSQTVMINKRCGWNADGTVRLLDKMVINNYSYPRIELTDGNYRVELLGYSSAYMSVRLMAQNIYTTQFATKAEMNSEIKQTVEEIDMSVNKKLTNYSTTTQMNSAINIKANEITSSVNKKFESYDTSEEVSSKIEQTADSINSSVNSKLTNYSTTTQMNSAINQKANEITSTVSSTYETKKDATSQYSQIKQTTDRISSEVSKKVGNNEIISKINQSAEAVGINANKINLSANDILNLLSGNTINLTSRNIIISSDAFQVDKNGKVTASNINITSGKIKLQDGTADNANLEVVSTSGNGARSYITPTEIQVGDGSTYLKFSNGILNVGKASSGGLLQLTQGSSRSNSKFNMYVGDAYVVQGNMHALSFLYDSLESLKKNISKYDKKALDIIKNAEIYTYNFKSEDDTNKKHYGFIIPDKGGSYKTPEEVLSEDKQGIDTYSMSSIMWKAIQELIQQNEQLQKEIKEMKGEKVNGQD